jgi:hypothetical protein
MGEHKVDFSRYKGWFANIRGFIAEHRLLVISVNREQCDMKPEYILCNYCMQFPQTFSWIVDDLRAFQIEEHRWLLYDWNPRVFVVCWSVSQREGFDLGRWIGGNSEPQGQ